MEAQELENEGTSYIRISGAGLVFVRTRVVLKLGLLICLLNVHGHVHGVSFTIDSALTQSTICRTHLQLPFLAPFCRTVMSCMTNSRSPNIPYPSHVLEWAFSVWSTA
jgi:hypothetical protein